MRKKLDQWRALTIGERWLLVQFAFLLPAIGSMLRCLGMTRTYRLLGGRAASASAASSISLAAQESAERLGQLIDIASRHGPYRATCLRQALALWWLLRRRGLPAELRIGVAKVEEQLQAHAWVELAGRAISQHAGLADDYAVFEDLDHRLRRRIDGLLR